MLVDTHCHIHEADYPIAADEVMARAQASGVEKLICVGTSMASSEAALRFSAAHDNVFASIGVHPHDTKDGWEELWQLKISARLVAVGEIGLDYYYNHSPRSVQIEALEGQIALAQKLKIPIIFHVREAFDDFWPIFDNFHSLRGVLHSFTDTQANMEKALSRGLYIGVNGISTFTNDVAQQTMYTALPLERMLIETDAPFLTPVPFRGKVNEPAFARNIAEYHAIRRGVSVDEIAVATSANAHALFAL